MDPSNWNRDCTVCTSYSTTLLQCITLLAFHSADSTTAKIFLAIHLLGRSPQRRMKNTACTLSQKMFFILRNASIIFNQILIEKYLTSDRMKDALQHVHNNFFADNWFLYISQKYWCSLLRMWWCVFRSLPVTNYLLHTVQVKAATKYVYGDVSSDDSAHDTEKWLPCTVYALGYQVFCWLND